jgi:uncharacterized membrane protein
VLASRRDEMRTLPTILRLVILVGYLLGAFALHSGLPEQVPPSWTVPGLGTLWMGGAMMAFLLPTAVAITAVLLRGLCLKDPVDESSSVNVLAIYDAIMLRFSIFVISVHGAVLLAMLRLLSSREWVAQLVPVMLGFTMISVGNLLPRTRPNLALGIRTRHTLADRRVWMQVHRDVGYLVVFLGAVVIASAVTMPEPVGPAMILVVGPAALFGTCLLLRYSRPSARA